MKKLFKQGFTLVELLIVIAIIGILAIAVLAALDPVQQLRKSRDSGKLADARELLNAYSRFYAAKGCYPADFSSGSNSCLSTSLGVSGVNTTNTNVSYDMSKMIAEGELKTSYTSKANVKNGWLFVGITTTGTNSVCFPAESKNSQTGGLNGTYDLANTGTITPVAAPATTLCEANYVANALDASCNVCVQ